MSWLLFLDESGHDQRTMPYEVRGGIALDAAVLWSFIQAVHSLEHSIFGCRLSEVGSEIKGSKLLQRERFKWAAQESPLDEQARRKHALNFLNSSAAKRVPRRIEFTAYGQACLAFCERLLDLLHEHRARLFAAFTPTMLPPGTANADVLRQDLSRVVDAFASFIMKQGDREDRQETGLLVMDRTDLALDKRLGAAFEHHAKNTGRGLNASAYVVPSPFFVDSDSAVGVQAADVCIYTLNWAYRTDEMTAPVRADLLPLMRKLRRLIWYAEGQAVDSTERRPSVMYLGNPYPLFEQGLFNDPKNKGRR